MCVSPNYVWVEEGPNWIKQTVPCRGCWRCQQRRVNDYVGRCMAEASYSDWTVTLTLTYAPWEQRSLRGEEYDLADKVVTPDHFQKFVRAVRRRGHSIRYFVAGEYGDKRGRAHFHAILFGTGAKPRWEIRDRALRLAYMGEPDRASKAATWPQQELFHCTEWPHGHVFADWSMDVRTIRYAAKYLNKREPGESWFSLSKKPSLGHAYFMDLADRAVAYGVLPASFEYIPPGVQESRKYLMTGATRRDYLLRIIERWSEDRPMQMDTLNEWVRAAIEKVLFDAHVRSNEHYWRDLGQEDAEKAMAQFMDTLAETLDRKRPTAEQVAKQLRHGAMRWLVDPLDGLYFIRDNDGTLVRIDAEGTETPLPGM